jgi:hypothetical protein
MAQSLIIKDGNGNASALAVESGSYGLIPVHYVTSSNINPVYITGSLSVNTASTIEVSNFPETVTVTSSIANPVYVSTPPVTTVIKNYSSSYDWTTVASGTFTLAQNNTNRKGLTIFNPGPYNLYIAYSNIANDTNGFILSSTSSAPDLFSFVLYASGTYFADNTLVGVCHGGYFISGSSNAVFMTEIS